MLNQTLRRNISLLLLVGLLGLSGAFYAMATDGEELEDGTFTGSAEGYQSDVEVEVVVEEGRITAISVVEHGETEAIAEPAFETLTDALIQAQSLEIDVVSGATLSSEAFIVAVSRALGLYQPELEDGTHTGSAQGYQSEIVVEVTVADGVITAVEVVESDETPGLSDPAIEQIPPAVVEAQSTAVETVTGATETSQGILDAVADALGW